MKFFDASLQKFNNTASLIRKVTTNVPISCCHKLNVIFLLKHAIPAANLSNLIGNTMSNKNICVPLLKYACLTNNNK